MSVAHHTVGCKKIKIYTISNMAVIDVEMAFFLVLRALSVCRDLERSWV